MVAWALGHLWQFAFHLLCLLGGDDFECAAVAGSLEGEVATIDNLARVELQLGVFALTACGDAVGQLALAVAFGQWRLVVNAVVPDDVAGRHVAACAEAELDGAAEGIEELVVVLRILHVDFVRQSEVEELVDGVEQVCAPVAESSHAEVVPAAPVALVVELAEVMVAYAAVPCVVVHAFGDRIALGHLRHVPVVLVPAAVVVHVSHHLRYVLDDAGFLPSLELEVVGLGVSLVADLCGKFRMAVGHLDEDFALLEGTDEGLLAIDVLAVLHGSHADEEVRVVGHADSHGVELVAVLVEELAEVGEALSIGVHLERLFALLALQVNVAERNDVHHVRLGEFVDVLLSAVADADVGNPYFLILRSRSGLLFLLGSQQFSGSQGHTSRSHAHSFQKISSC